MPEGGKSRGEYFFEARGKLICHDKNSSRTPHLYEEDITVKELDKKLWRLMAEKVYSLEDNVIAAFEHKKIP